MGPCVCVHDSQKRAAYTLRQKVQRWHIALFYFILDAALVNSFITHQLLQGTRDMTDQLSFRCALVDSLLAQGLSMLAGPAHILVGEDEREARERQQRRYPLPANRLLGDHFPVMVAKQGRCHYCYYKAAPSAEGKIHQGYSKVKCSSCNFYLCLTQTRNCFMDYHTSSGGKDDVCA